MAAAVAAAEAAAGGGCEGRSRAGQSCNTHPEAGGVKSRRARFNRGVHISATLEQVLGDLGVAALPAGTSRLEPATDSGREQQAGNCLTCALAKRIVEPTFGLLMASLYLPATTCFFTTSRFPARTACRNSFGARSPPMSDRGVGSEESEGACELPSPRHTARRTRLAAAPDL